MNTLDNAVYMNMKNDVSFVFGFYLNLYEHQSTFSPNIPLRDLFYIARLLEKEISGQSLYTSGIVKIPAPKFIVFYNGQEERPEEKILKLSDAYAQKTEQPELELVVRMLNVNLGKNKEIMEQCQLLKEYAHMLIKFADMRRS